MENNKVNLKCNYCNNIIADDSIYCEYCGKQVSISDTNKNEYDSQTASLLIAGNLENELLHIQREIESIKINKSLTKLSTFVFAIIESFFFICFIILFILLVYSFFFSNTEILELYHKNIKTISFEYGNDILQNVYVFKIIWFVISILILGCAIIFNSLRKQSIIIYRQNKIIKKIIININVIIDNLKKKK